MVMSLMKEVFASFLLRCSNGRIMHQFGVKTGVHDVVDFMVSIWA